MIKRNPFNSTTAPDNDVINGAVVRYQQLHAQFVEDLLAHEEVQGYLREHLTMLQSGEGARATDRIHKLIERLTSHPKLSGSEVLFQLGKLKFTLAERAELLRSLTSKLSATDSPTKTKKLQLWKLLGEIFAWCLPRLVTIAARYGKRYHEEPKSYLTLGYFCFDRALIGWTADKGPDFSSFLGTVFANGIKEELHDNHSVRGRRQAAGDLRAVEETIEKLAGQLRRPPTDEEVASAMGKSASIIKGILAQKIEMISMDAPLSHDSGDRTLHDSSLCLSHNDDQGGLIHPMDEKAVHCLIVSCVAKFLKSSPHRMSEEPPALALRLPARCFLPVKGDPRILKDAIAALRIVGMLDLKKALECDIRNSHE